MIYTKWGIMWNSYNLTLRTSKMKKFFLSITMKNRWKNERYQARPTIGCNIYLTVALMSNTGQLAEFAPGFVWELAKFCAVSM